VQAKLFLKRHGVPFTEYLLDDDGERQAFYQRVGDNVRSVPQIFVDGERIGGYAELIKSDILARQEAGTFDAEF
jgi:glutaredoxin